ncbi:membrane dipeptidase [bacterium AH-315-D21]|nr:membrane dipeptidase [bacterium AH-315-D21]
MQRIPLVVPGTIPDVEQNSPKAVPESRGDKDHFKMLIIDGDYPMAIAVHLNRDLTLPLDQVRSAPDLPGGRPDRSDAETMASLPEMRRGGVAAALVKVVVDQHREGAPMPGGPRSDDLSYALGQGQMAYYRILETRGEARILRTSSDVKKHMSEWENAESYDDLPVGFFLGMEGSDPILWPKQVHEWYADGLRVISIGHYGPARYGHGTGTGTDGGLLGEGEELLREMDACGMILDVTHTSDETVRQALDIFTGPVLASHQNCRALVPGERQQDDDLLKRVIERGAIIGASMDTWMLTRNVEKDWSHRTPQSRSDLFKPEDVTLEDVVDHIEHVCELAGDTLHSAIGGDTDGQGGAIGAPYDVDTVADYQKISVILGERGWNTADIENVMWRNWQRYFEEFLPA